MTKAVAAKPKVKGTTRALIEIAEVEGRVITLESVYPGSIYTHKILKARHNPKYSADFPKAKKPSILEQFANVQDKALKTAKVTTLEGMTREFAKLSEYMDRNRIKANPPIYDKAYVERSEFTITDLYNDIMSRIEWSLIRNVALIYTFGCDAMPYLSPVLDYSYYVQQRKKFRQCKYMFCMNMFAIEGDNFRDAKSKRVDSRFCSDECRKASHDAKRRYKSTGSYLPVEYYVPIYDESEGDRYRRNEVIKPFDKIEKQIAKGKVQSPVKIKPPSYKHGKVISFRSLADAKKAEENTDKVDIIGVYREIIRRTNPNIV